MKRVLFSVVAILAVLAAACSSAMPLPPTAVKAIATPSSIAPASTATTSAEPAATAAQKTLNVVAAQNFWGSIAAQLGGSHVKVTSIVTDPNADPHEYESNTNDARAFAEANYVIVNGAGYDTWAQKLLDANPVNGRKVMTVADLLGKKEGDNPHFWYSPVYVNQVADQITKDYQSFDPANADFFTRQRQLFAAAVKPYQDRIAAIKAQFAGVKVAATENIFVYLSDALGLDLISPPEFMQAVSEGNDPPVASVAAFHDRLTRKEATVLVYNVQTATAVTTNIKKLAADQNIPVVGVSETIQPPDVSFQDWQFAQLITLQNALNANTLAK